MVQAQPNSSFIPKKGGQVRRSASQHRMMVTTMLSLGLLGVSVLAAVALFLYQNYLDTQLQREVTGLTAAAAAFDTAELARVSAFDKKLIFAQGRIDTHVALSTVLSGLDSSIVDNVQLLDLEINRVGDESLQIEGAVAASSFDATLFQRNLYTANQRLFSGVVLEDVSLAVNTEREVQVDQQNADRRLDNDVLLEQVSFDVSLSVPVASVPFSPTVVTAPTTDSVAQAQATSTTVQESDSQAELTVNQTNQ